MPSYIKSGGVWHLAHEIGRKNTAWKNSKYGYVNQNGTWKIFHHSYGDNTFAWQTSAWSSCSAPCNAATTNGTQTRSVTCWCTELNEVSTDESYCTGTKPDASQPCGKTCKNYISSVTFGFKLSAQSNIQTIATVYNNTNYNGLPFGNSYHSDAENFNIYFSATLNNNNITVDMLDTRIGGQNWAGITTSLTPNQYKVVNDRFNNSFYLQASGTEYIESNTLYYWSVPDWVFSTCTAPCNALNPWPQGTVSRTATCKDSAGNTYANSVCTANIGDTALPSTTGVCAKKCISSPNRVLMYGYDFANSTWITMEAITKGMTNVQVSKTYINNWAQYATYNANNTITCWWAQLFYNLNVTAIATSSVFTTDGQTITWDGDASHRYGGVVNGMGYVEVTP